MADAQASARREQLRALLGDGRLHLTPGVTNAFHGLLAAEAGFDAIFLTGGGIANALLGVPDIGLTTLTETVELARRVAGAIDRPLLADGDTGYGNHLNTMRTVVELERAGVAGLTLEDQVAPKRCGHFAGKRVVPVREMVEKLLAAKKARTDPALVIVARTDALASEGLEATLARARAYVAAGADAIFVEALRTRDELAAIPLALDVPCVVNIVEGGATPIVPADELERMGYAIALYANLALRVAGHGVRRAFAALARDGHSGAMAGEMLSWEERQGLVGHPTWQALEAAITAEAERLVGGESARVAG